MQPTAFAGAVIHEYCEGKHDNLFIARITTKNNRRRYSSIDGENHGQIGRSLLLLITVRYCSKEMKEEDRVIANGPFKGKKIRFAPTNGVNMFVEISEELMRKIFDFEPGEYLITDESSLYDFTGLDEM